MNDIILTGAGALQQGPDIIERFLTSLDVKERSRETYRKALKQFTQWMQVRGRQATERADILEYKAYLQGRYAATTVSAYITAVRKLFGFLEAEKIYPNITAGIKGGKAARGFRKDALTTEQARNLLTGIERSTTEGKRDFALVNLLVQTGLRTIEAQRANIEDIRQEGGAALLYIQGKGRDEKDAFVLLTESTLKPIRAYLKARGREAREGSAPLFAGHGNRNQNGRMTTRTISRIAKDHLKAAGIDSDRITAHSLRHTAVTLSLLAGASIQEAQQLARHSSVNTTMIYAHNIDRVKNAPERRISALLAV